MKLVAYCFFFDISISSFWLCVKLQSLFILASLIIFYWENRMYFFICNINNNCCLFVTNYYIWIAYLELNNSWWKWKININVEMYFIKYSVCYKINYSDQGLMLTEFRFESRSKVHETWNVKWRIAFISIASMFWIKRKKIHTIIVTFIKTTSPKFSFIYVFNEPLFSKKIY